MIEIGQLCSIKENVPSTGFSESTRVQCPRDAAYELTPGDPRRKQFGMRSSSFYFCAPHWIEYVLNRGEIE